MALLTLVRHGQASFLQDNYDKLSERGELQSRILGEYWLRTGAAFDQVYYGPACRHLRTGEIVAEVYRRRASRGRSRSRCLSWTNMRASKWCARSCPA